VADRDALAAQFEQHRPHLNRVAYRMLGSTAEAEDAVQEAWLRLVRTDSEAVANLGGWLTTVVARVCLDLLRRRRATTADLDVEQLVEVEGLPGEGPEDEALLADSVGLALLVVLETLTPAERLAFVLHDMFAVPFDEIGEIVERTPEAARQLASRARRRVRGAAPLPDADLARQRALVDAFLAASRAGDFDALVAVLDPQAVIRVRARPDEQEATHGAAAVARRVLARGSRLAHLGRPALVNGAVGALVGRRELPIAVVAFTFADGRIAAVDVHVGPGRAGADGVPGGRR
jgi:RNA polymerase sigma factor (sigma-70 family)